MTILDTEPPSGAPIEDDLPYAASCDEDLFEVLDALGLDPDSFLDYDDDLLDTLLLS